MSECKHRKEYYVMAVEVCRQCEPERAKALASSELARLAHFLERNNWSDGWELPPEVLKSALILADWCKRAGGWVKA